MRKCVKDICYALVVLCVGLFFLNGCSGKTNVAADSVALPQVSSFADDIKDIELPMELKWNRDDSKTIKTDSFVGGIWQYEGRVEALSLKDYMINSMQSHKWKVVGQSTSDNILLAFVKPNKTCMMVITDNWLGKTTLTLYVTIDRKASVGLNSFGNAVAQ